MPNCPMCGEAIPETSGYCRHCGADLDAATDTAGGEPNTDAAAGRTEPEPLSVDEMPANALHPSVTRERLVRSGNDSSPNVPQDFPIVDHLMPGEQPHFIFYNKGKGVAIGDPSNKTTPRVTNICYNIFTDTRILVIVATKEGDKMLTIPYGAITHYDTKSIFGGTRVRVDTVTEPYFLWVSSDFSNDVDDAFGYVSATKPAESTETPTDLMLATATMGSASGDTTQFIPEGSSSYVTPERVRKVQDILDPDEEVWYLTRGSTIDVEGSGAGGSLFGDDRSRKTGTRGYVRAAFTGSRVAIKVPQWLGSDQRSLPYRNILAVNLDTGMVTKRVTLQTAGETYHIEAHEPGKNECRNLVKFIREKLEAEQTDSGGGSSVDPTEQLKNISELHDQGVLSDEEFEQKKQDLLDKI